MLDYKKKIIQFLNKKLNEKFNEDIIETPPSEELGDYALPCFSLSKKLKKPPVEITKELEKLKFPDFILKSEAKGPYLNFFLNNQILIKDVLNEINKKKKNYGKLKNRNYIVVIESPGPNTNKPLHLGHIRNMLLGNSLVNLSKAVGNKTFRVDIVNDRGIHIGMSQLAYKKYGKNKKPNKKPDHFVGDFYVLYSIKLKENPDLEKELREYLVKWEKKDKETVQLWKKLNSWAMKGIKETYKRFGVKINKTYYESDHYKKGKKIVEKGLRKNVFKKDSEGNIIIDLENKSLGKKVVLRKDGTSVYITQDMALADLRYKDFKMNNMIYVVGNEQIYHFKVLFEIFQKLEYKFSDNLFHLAYGMVYLPGGKLKSREGKIVDADNLADEMNELAKKEVLERNKKISKKELKELSEKIGMGALKFFMLKYSPFKDFTYDPKESIKFQGDTGVYVLYTYVRTNSILKKSKDLPKTRPSFKLLNEKLEEKLVKILSRYPEIIKDCAEKSDPSILCNYLLDLCHTFNEYYHKYKVINLNNKDRSKARLFLVDSVRQVLENGLEMLGVDPPKKM